MESEGQRTSSTPSAVLASLLCKRAKLHEELRNIEKQAEEQAAGRDGGALLANGQGKPKKGRGGPRDAKRSRQSSEPDFDYEDDADLM